MTPIIGCQCLTVGKQRKASAGADLDGQTDNKRTDRSGHGDGGGGGGGGDDEKTGLLFGCWLSGAGHDYVAGGQKTTRLGKTR